MKCSFYGYTVFHLQNLFLILIDPETFCNLNARIKRKCLDTLKKNYCTTILRSLPLYYQL